MLGKASNCKNGKGGAWANSVYKITQTGFASLPSKQLLTKKIGLKEFVRNYQCPADKTREGHLQEAINFFDKIKNAKNYPLHRAAFAGDV